MTYFEFYQIPVSFTIDEAVLKRIFYQNSKKYHPDFHTLSGEAQQSDMLELSSLNNEAYKTLSDPDLRMRYILTIKGLLGDEKNQPALPQDFLMEMMDINEALMDMEFAPNPEIYQQTLKTVEDIENQEVNSIQPVLDGFSSEKDDPATMLSIRDFYLKKRYLLRIRENLSKFASAF